MLKINGKIQTVQCGSSIVLNPGERVTLVPGVYHEFLPVSDECIIGEVSTANDDLHDNFFINSDVGRYPGIEEDEPAVVRLVSEQRA
jgi:D-lyxose ketol-isomerase